MASISEEKTALIEAARGAGFKVSSKQIDRYRFDGVMPPAKPAGLGYSKGVKRPVSDAEARQVIALLGLLRENRSLHNAAFRLWVGEYNISLERFRKALLSLVAEPIENVKSKSLETQTYEVETFESTIVRKKTAPKKMKRYARKGQLASPILLLLRETLGQGGKSTSAERASAAKVFEEISGLENGRRELPDPNVRPLISGDITEKVFELLPDAGSFPDLIRNATTLQLERARQNFLNAEKVVLFARYAKTVYGHAFGLEGISALSNSDAELGPMLFVGVLSLERTIPDLADRSQLIGQAADSANAIYEARLAQDTGD